MSLVLSNSYVEKFLLRRSKVAEALNINGTRLCKLPDLPTPMSGQTMSGRLLCGGRDSNGIPKSCIKFENGLWVELPWNLQENRSQHVSWTRSDGKTRLFGGYYFLVCTQSMCNAWAKQIRYHLNHVGIMFQLSSFKKLYSSLTQGLGLMLPVPEHGLSAPWSHM